MRDNCDVCSTSPAKVVFEYPLQPEQIAENETRITVPCSHRQQVKVVVQHIAERVPVLGEDGDTVKLLSVREVRGEGGEK